MSFHAFLRRRGSKLARKQGLRWPRPFLEELEYRRLLTTFIVNSTADNSAVDLATGKDKDGNITLRSALEAVNAGSGPEVINFNIPVTDPGFNAGQGVATIQPILGLPVINHSVVIDAMTQLAGSADHPKIELDGRLAANSNGLAFAVGGNTVKGFIICNFADFGIELDGSGDPAHNQGAVPNNLIQSNFLGTDFSGTVAQPNKLGGIKLRQSANNLIGGDDQGMKLVEGNLISGNRQTGIFLADKFCTGNFIEGNFIGTQVSGLAPLIGAQPDVDGIFLGPPVAEPDDGFPSGNFIGNILAGTIDPDARNIIAGNTDNGIFILGGMGNVVTGNYIGIGADGKTPIANGKDGIRLESASANTIGGTLAGAGNVVSGNAQNGIEIVAVTQSSTGVPIPVPQENASGNSIQGNFIGTDSTGSVANIVSTDLQGTAINIPLGNGQDGIVLRNLAGVNSSVQVSGNLIGGDDAKDGTVDGKVLAQNVISGNRDNGILLEGPQVNLNTIAGNRIGTDKSGESALANLSNGILLDSLQGEASGPSGNIIGGSTAGAYNVISGNGLPGSAGAAPGDGVQLADEADGNFVIGNRIGTDDKQLKALANAGNGVLVENSDNNFIGGSGAGAGNTISGNVASGVAIIGLSQNNTVERNDVGIGATGGDGSSALVPNHLGVSFDAGPTTGSPSQNVISHNVIAANADAGVTIGGGAFGNSLVGNKIGTDDGEDDLGNGDTKTRGDGIRITEGAGNVIGGTTVADRNLIVFNNQNGIVIRGASSTLNSVLGNYIGVGPDGAKAEGNHADGVLIDGAPGNIIGGSLHSSPNIISGNTGAGVHIKGQAAITNSVLENDIGTDSQGKQAVGNFDGVLITDGASFNTIVGALLSGNNEDGAQIDDSGDNSVRGNTIGVGVDRLTAVPNQGDGIVVSNSPGAIIGGDSFEADGNLISGNKLSGIFLGGAHTVGAQIKGNHIGFVTNEGEDVVLGNETTGVTISKDVSATGPSQIFVTGNVIGGNKKGGIRVIGSSDVHITANKVGVGSNNGEQVDLPNTVFGISVENSANVQIGDTGATNANTIAFTAFDPGDANSQNPTSGNGIVVSGSKSTFTNIENNRIFANANAGIQIEAGATHTGVGGFGIVQGNIIVSNGTGIEITGSGTAHNTVFGNLIGIDSDNTPAGNKDTGIALDDSASDNLIGGGANAAADGSQNVISANGFAGVGIGDKAHDNTVSGNLIGTDRSGKFQPGIGNVAFGVFLTNDAGGNIIGGAARAPGDGPGNKIVGNGVGIGLFGNGNIVQGNLIASSQGAPPVNDFPSRPGDGVLVFGNNNRIGGPDKADANIIRDNTANGVSVASGTGNSIRQNQIFKNAALGIRLDQGGKGNNLQSAPVLALATTGSSDRLAGWLNARPNTTYTLEFFAGPSFEHQDQSEDDDAEQLVQPTAITSASSGTSGLFVGQVTTNVGGAAVFDLTLPPGLAENLSIRATATDPNGNTSAFSDAAFLLPDGDGDGVSDRSETNTGSGSQDAGVVSFPDALSQNGTITLNVTSPQGDPLPGVSFQNAWSIPDPSPADPNGPQHTQFGLGFIDFKVAGVTAGAHIIVTVTLPVQAPAGSIYYRFGKTPNTPVQHWYDWNYDKSTDTGAEINGNTLILHFVNGGRGDDDLDPNNNVIEDPGSVGFPDAFTVTTTADDGPGSLRQAIVNANASSDQHTITFSIPGPAPQTIQLLSPLPSITAQYLTIDGLTLPATEAGNNLARAAPVVELDGSQAGAGADGLTVDAGYVTIRGLVINRFSGDGIRMESADGSDTIERSLIGVDISGATALGNGRFGIEIDNSPYNNIGSHPTPRGGRAPGANIISGNAMGGIFVHGSNANHNDVRDNLIGTQADGISPLGNGGPGVLLDSQTSFNSIGTGKPEEGNTIAFNTGTGVDVRDGLSNPIEANSIFANGGLGIDLGGDGVTLNDPDESAAGANDLQNFPVLTQIVNYGSFLSLAGTLTSTPNASFTLDFYANDHADPSGFGQGKTFLKSLSVSTDATGQAAFDFILEQAFKPGSFITATATNRGHDTSEFSLALQVAATPAVLVLTVNTTDDVNDAVPDPAHFSLREAILAANSHPGQDIIQFALPDQDRTISPLSQLPDITDPVIIDGTSQLGYGGLPLVELEGSNAGNGVDGLRITGGGSIVRGLIINRFQNDPVNGGHSGAGIVLSGPGGNRIEGNFLGTDVTGTQALPNFNGDVLVNGSPDNLIGGTTPAARNVIFHVVLNGFDAATGQVLTNSGGNRVEGNFIGTDMTGTALLHGVNGPGGGIIIESSPSNTIGGTAPGAGNVINGKFGVFGSALEIDDASDNVVQGNLIGTDFTGTVALSSGVVISGQGLPATRNLIGGTSPAARNIIPEGIAIRGGRGDGNLVEGNYIGTDITGTVALGHYIAESEGGVFVESAVNAIGGTTPGAGNLISGNQGGSGIVFALSAFFNTVQGNWIGIDATGTRPLGNVDGIFDNGHDNTIGGFVAGAGNVISGNLVDGVIAGRSDAVVSNYIGTDFTGTLALGNGGDGIVVSGNSAHIGQVTGTGGFGNVISANQGNGVSFASNGSVYSVAIQANHVGMDVTGTVPLGNGGAGILMEANLDSLIGGTLPGAANLISANAGDGIRIADSAAVDDVFGRSSVGIVIQGNRIGTDVTGALPFGNGGNGISIITSNHVAGNETIGGTVPGAGNVIAFNRGFGVSALVGAGNAIRENDIFANGGLGIAVDVNGVLATYAESRSANLALAAGLLTPPHLTLAAFDPQGTLVGGSFNGAPLTRYEIDFFANDTVNPSGFGDGQRFLESISLLTDEIGSAQFQIPLDEPVPVGQWLSATATDPAGNSSPFSQDIPVVAALAPITVQFSAPAYVVTEGGAAAVVVVTRQGSTAGAATVDYATSDGTALAGVNYTEVSGNLVFKDGESSKTVTIPVKDDGIANGNKNFQIVLRNPALASLGSIGSATVTIADEDAAGQVGFTTAAFSVDHAQESPSFIVTRTGGSRGRITVDYRVTGGTAVPFVNTNDVPGDTDFNDNYGTLTFDDGQTTAKIDFNYVLDFNHLVDPLYHGPRTIELTLGNPTGGATLGAITTSTVTIEDEENRAGAFSVVALGENGASVHERAGKVTIGVGRAGNLTGVETIHYATVDGAAKGGTNYLAVSGTLTFNFGDTRKFFDVPILDDGVVGDPGSFQVVISDPSGVVSQDAGGPFIFDGFDRATVNILDSDGPAPPDQIVVTEMQYSEDGGSAQINVTRSGNGAFQVDFATSDGTAKAGSDYTATSGTLTFPSGQASASFSVPLLPDHDVTGAETFFVTLSNPVGNAVISGKNPATMTIIETPGQVNFSATKYVVAEANADLAVTIGFTSQSPSGLVTVDYRTVDGTAQAGVRYVPVSGTLTFGSGNGATQTITIPILNNALVDGDQTFTLVLSSPTGGASLGPNSIVPATILDEDTARAQLAVDAGGPYTIAEGDSLTLSASVSGGTASDLSWDVNGDGVFGDATGPNPTLTWNELQALGIVDGPSTFTLSVRATDSIGREVVSAPATLTLQNVAPTAVFNNNGPIPVGSAATVSFSSVLDPSGSDQTAGFRFNYDFDNDGKFEIVDSASRSVTVPASFLAGGPGSYVVHGRVTDKDGGFTDLTTTVTVSAENAQSGQIGGVIFLDYNSNGIRESDEPELPGMTVYLDSNHDGQLTAGEKSIATGIAGAFTFSNLAPANYLVRQDFVPDHGIVPTSATSLNLALSSGATLSGQDFGEVLISQVAPAGVIANRFGNARSVPDALVEGYYHNLLERAPEPAALLFWGNILSASASNLTSRQLVFQQIWESAEHREVEVVHYYATFFHRQADATGAAYFVHQFLTGATEQQVVLGFVLSAEYQQLQGGSIAFVGAMFKDLLSRTGNASDLQYWSNLSKTAGAQAAALGIMNSDESRLRMIDGYYAALLHRAGETAGRNFWLDQFIRGNLTIESVASGFLAGTLQMDEYFRSAQATVE
jgi:hypothetical protein